MRVVLLKNIKGIGQIGDIKEVSEGYGRNFLLPQGAAKAATAGLVKEVASMRLKKLESVQLQHQEAQELAARLTGLTIPLTEKANGKGTLFAGLETAHLAEAVRKATGIAVSPHSIKLKTPIKTTGEFQVQIELTDQVSATVTFVVTAI